MLAESLKISSAPPDNWPKSDEYYRRHFPEKMEGGIKRLVENGHVTDVDTEEHPLVGVFLGSQAITEGLGPFYETRVFRDLQTFCEFKADGGWEATSAFISGSVGYGLVTANFMINKFRYKNMPWHWYPQMAGVSPYYEKGMDMDIWITEQGYEYVKSKSENYLHVGKETSSRTVKGLKLLTVGEKTSSRWLKFQFHTINDSKLTPMAQAMLLAPTNLHKTGVGINKVSFAAVDPEASLHEGPWHQKPPMHLIDSENPLAENVGRILNGLMIYSVMTPKLDKKRYSDEFALIRKYVTVNLDKLTITERNVFLEKLDHWHKQAPWNDYMADCVYKTSEKLAITGFMPKVLDWILNSENKEYTYGFLYEILEYAEYLKMPEVAGLYIPECNTSNPKYYDLAVKIARKIDWKEVAQ